MGGLNYGKGLKIFMAEVSKTEWEKFTQQYPQAHLLQTAAWGQLKAAFGWQMQPVIADQVEDVFRCQCMKGIVF